MEPPLGRRRQSKIEDVGWDEVAGAAVTGSATRRLIRGRYDSEYQIPPDCTLRSNRLLVPVRISGRG